MYNRINIFEVVHGAKCGVKHAKIGASPKSVKLKRIHSVLYIDILLEHVHGHVHH